MQQSAGLQEIAVCPLDHDVKLFLTESMRLWLSCVNYVFVLMLMVLSNWLTSVSCHPINLVPFTPVTCSVFLCSVCVVGKMKANYYTLVPPGGVIICLQLMCFFTGSTCSNGQQTEARQCLNKVRLNNLKPQISWKYPNNKKKRLY